MYSSVHDGMAIVYPNQCSYKLIKSMSTKQIVIDWIISKMVFVSARDKVSVGSFNVYHSSVLQQLQLCNYRKCNLDLSNSLLVLLGLSQCSKLIQDLRVGFIFESGSFWRFEPNNDMSMLITMYYLTTIVPVLDCSPNSGQSEGTMTFIQTNSLV